MKTYELFSGNNLDIAELIQQRRYQLLIHSCIYYHLNTNLISDRTWDLWAKELLSLQQTYPEISNCVTLFEYFKDWDASTGAFLPITSDWVVALSKRILKLHSVSLVKKENIQLKKLAKRKLF